MRIRKGCKLSRAPGGACRLSDDFMKPSENRKPVNSTASTAVAELTACIRAGSPIHEPDAAEFAAHRHWRVEFRQATGARDAAMARQHRAIRFRGVEVSRTAAAGVSHDQGLNAVRVAGRFEEIAKAVHRAASGRPGWSVPPGPSPAAGRCETRAPAAPRFLRGRTCRHPARRSGGSIRRPGARTWWHDSLAGCRVPRTAFQPPAAP